MCIVRQIYKMDDLIEPTWIVICILKYSFSKLIKLYTLSIYIKNLNFSLKYSE
jgi:hypothetical protein